MKNITLTTSQPVVDEFIAQSKVHCSKQLTSHPNDILETTCIRG